MDCLHSGHVARSYGVNPHTVQSMLQCLDLSVPAPGYVAAPPVLTSNATSTNVPLHHILVGRSTSLPAELHDCLVRVGSVLTRERRMLLANSRLCRLCLYCLRSTLVLLMKVKHASIVISACVLDLAHRHCMRCCLPLDLSHHQSHGSCSAGYARVVGSMRGIISGAPGGYGSLGALEVPIAPTPPLLEPCQSPIFVEHGGLDATITHSHATIGHVVSSSDNVNEASAMAPRYGKEIA
jgi:hypothetical protein